MKIEISDDEIQAALEAYFMTYAPRKEAYPAGMKRAIEAALKVRKARKKARKRLESEHGSEQWGACV